MSKFPFARPLTYRERMRASEWELVLICACAWLLLGYAFGVWLGVPLKHVFYLALLTRAQ